MNGITRISVKGFKSIAEERSIEIRPLTILAGANSSGKTSIMQPLLMMKQTLDATYDPGPILIEGPNIKFTLIDQFLSKVNNNLVDAFKIEIEVDKTNYMSEVFRRNPESGIDVEEINYFDNKTLTFKLRPFMEQNEIIAAMPKEFYRNFKKMNFQFRIERKRFFLKAIGTSSGKEIGSGITFDPGPDLNKYIENIQKIIHLPALRGNPERTYKTVGVGVGPLFLGRFENYIASIINHWKSIQDPRLQMLATNLELLGLTWKVEIRPVNDTNAEILVGRLIHKKDKDFEDFVSIADVGYGVSQTLPILVALLVAEPGQLVFIEQPEIHIHPKAQTAMSQILADAAQRGVNVVVETHSSLLLLGIQSLVAENRLPCKKVMLHWFERRENDGITDVSSTELDDAGAFGNWPEDFADVQLNADIRFIRASESHLEE